MELPDRKSPVVLPGVDRFATTHWSCVLAARDRSSPASRHALSQLCEIYWYPLYAFVRRQGRPAHEAQDLIQEFFARLLEKEYLQVVDREKGKFRSFLLAALKHFLSNERDRARAQKRGGRRAIVSLDLDSAEGRYQHEPADTVTPERLFERRWALALLERVLARLGEEYRRAGKGKSFDELKEFLTGENDARPYREVAAELNTSEGAIKVAVHRLRRRYRELLQEEIGQTVAGPEEVADEIRHLFAALAGEKG